MCNWKNIKYNARRKLLFNRNDQQPHRRDYGHFNVPTWLPHPLGNRKWHIVHVVTSQSCYNVSRHMFFFPIWFPQFSYDMNLSYEALPFMAPSTFTYPNPSCSKQPNELRLGKEHFCWDVSVFRQFWKLCNAQVLNSLECWYDKKALIQRHLMDLSI